MTVKPRKVFVVGLHRSGTSILAELLKSHPLIAGHQIDEMPPELENEGQHVQTVFPPDDALGWPGYFAFNRLARAPRGRVGRALGRVEGRAPREVAVEPAARP